MNDYMRNQPSTHSTDPFNSPSSHGHSFPCSSSAPCNKHDHFSLRVEFFKLLKIDSGHFKDTGVTLFTMATPGNSAITPVGKLNQSPPSPIPGDRARGKRRSRRAPLEISRDPYGILLKTPFRFFRVEPALFRAKWVTRLSPNRIEMIFGENLGKKIGSMWAVTILRS